MILGIMIASSGSSKPPEDLPLKVIVDIGRGHRRRRLQNRLIFVAVFLLGWFDGFITAATVWKHFHR